MRCAFVRPHPIEEVDNQCVRERGEFLSVLEDLIERVAQAAAGPVQDDAPETVEPRHQ